MLLLAGSVLLNLAPVPIVLGVLLAVVYVKNNRLRSVRTITVRVWLALYSGVRVRLMLASLKSGDGRRWVRMGRTR